jgi:pyridoxamine 5'-phosphate oxidase
MKNDFPSDPTDLFHEWFQLAEEKEPSYPGAMALATVSEEGRPAVRVVLMRGFNEKGLHFYTNYESAKGRALIANPYAEANFYWKSIERQIRVSGKVEKTSEDESDLYYNNRPRASRVGAWASRQSRPMQAYSDLEKAVEEFDQKFDAMDNPPRPPHWGGFRIIPERLEFWAEQPYRLHKRFVYSRNADGSWSIGWLYP